jgi:hypothetical protein
MFTVDILMRSVQILVGDTKKNLTTLVIVFVDGTRLLLMILSLDMEFVIHWFRTVYATSTNTDVSLFFQETPTNYRVSWYGLFKR